MPLLLLLTLAPLGEREKGSGGEKRNEGRKEKHVHVKACVP